MEKRFWEALCRHLGVPQYADLQYDDHSRTEILKFMRSTFRKKTLDEWDAELGELEICWGRVQNLTEVLDDPLFRERKMVLQSQEKSGKNQPAIGISVKLSETPGSVRSAAVDFGESTASILKELGYSDKQIKKFASAEVI